MSRNLTDMRQPRPRPRARGLAPMVFWALIVTLLLIASLGVSSAFAATGSVQVTVNVNQSLGSLTSLSKGLNTAVWDGNLMDSAASTAVKNAGVGVLRYPGGSTSDVYHWQSNTNVSGQGTDVAGDNFDAFMRMAQNTGVQPVITVNYGGGTPSEAAGWVQYANKGGSGYNGPVPTYSGGSSTGHNYGIKYWEVGNEVYGDGTYGASWEYNNYPHTSAAYASNLVTYSQAMKAVDPSIYVGAVLTAPGNWPDGVTNSSSPQTWNTTVLSTACSSIDFVILHWYPQNPGNESDSTLLSSPSQIATMVSTTRSELSQYCGAHASAVQILVTETNSVSSNPGKQTVSTVNALYEDDDYMSWLENGVTNVDWWTLHNGPVAGNTSSSLYGTAQYGDYGVLADAGCTSATSGICEPAADTPFPAYYGLQMLNYLGQAGDTMVSSSSNQSLVAVHAVKQANGNVAVLLINKDASNSYNVTLNFNGFLSTLGGRMYTYGENSTGITNLTIDPPGNPGSSTNVTVAPYSLTTIVLTPASGVTPTPTVGTTPTATPTQGITPTPTPTQGITPTPTPTQGITPTPTPTQGITPTPTPTQGTTPTPTPTTTSSSCRVHYAVNSQWQGGFSVALTITNTGTTTINGWSLKFSFANGQTITQLWNGSYTQSGSAVTISNLSYNGTIAPGASLNSAPGFNGTWNGTNSAPTAYTLNGQACSIG